MRRIRRRRGRRRSRPLFEAIPKNVLGLLAASLLISLVISKGVIPVTAEKPERPLEGRVVFIDPGHGGIDPGACGNTYTEKEIVLKVALLLGSRLERSGARAVYTRTGDYDLETPDVSDVEARIEMMKGSGAWVAVSIHCDDFTDPYVWGAQVFYNASKHPGSKQLARLIQDELAKATGTERDISADLDHFILNHAEMPAVTVELGFLFNPDEERLLGSGEHQEKLATCIYEAILAFLTSQ